MFYILLNQIAMFGLLAMCVLALDAIVFAWLGGWRGLLLGEIYLVLYVLLLDLNVLPGPKVMAFYQNWALHLVVVNLMILPAWVLGLLLRQIGRERRRSLE
jgi:hypothetical protein